MQGVLMVSIIVPTYNEADNVEELAGEIDAVLSREGIDAEVIFADDGSTDGSWAKIAGLAAKDSRIRGVRLRRNFGKAAALSAGIKASKGDRIITMDADLQDNPAEIPRLLAKLDEGYDVVSGWKKRRYDPWHKVLPSRVFNWLIGKMCGPPLHDHNCGLKCYRAEVLQEVSLYGELHRFITVLAHARGFRVTEIAVEHRPRVHGVSKYGAKRFLKGFLDLMTVRFLTGYGQRPLHLLGTLGAVAFLLGLVGMVYLAALWLMGDRPIGNRPILMYSVAALLLGAQWASVGMLAELLTAHNATSCGDKTYYSIAERTGE
jgi:glycosyltransferase involved in cell wall biosynthesis